MKSTNNTMNELIERLRLHAELVGAGVANESAIRIAMDDEITDQIEQDRHTRETKTNK